MLTLPALLVFTAIFAFLHTAYFLLFFMRVAFFKRKPANNATVQPPVSIIICARNEKVNLEKNLVGILNQKYPRFEVIVVNDFSTDGTADFLIDLGLHYKHLYYTNISAETTMLSGKKFALTIGMKAAQYDYVLLTDADCTPASDQWLTLMMEGYSAKKEIVLGYAPYTKQPGMLNKIIRFEAFYAGMQYLGFALSGIPYMGVGRNLGYKRRLFFDHSYVFVKHPNLMSGDDDLFVNAACNRKNTAVQINADGFVYSTPKLTWEEWRYQKRRHLSTARYYRKGHKLLLGLFSLLHILFYFSFFASLIFCREFYQWALLIWAVRLIISTSVVYGAMRKLRETDLIWIYPLLDLALLFYYLIFTPAALTRRQAKKWK